jgi:aconitate hydratase
MAASAVSSNPYDRVLSALNVGPAEYKYYSLSKLGDARLKSLPYSIRVLLEAAVRNADNFSITEKDVEKILDWQKTSKQSVEIPFKPARVLMQDFTYAPNRALHRRVQHSFCHLCCLIYSQGCPGCRGPCRDA